MSSVRLECTGIGPSLTVNDIEKSERFYKEALGFEVASRDEAGGTPRFVMFKAGNGFLGIGQDDFAKGRDRVKGIGVRLWIETEQDLQALADQAKAAGVTLDSEVQQLPWGVMAFAVTDPDGYKITVTQPQPR